MSIYSEWSLAAVISLLIVLRWTLSARRKQYDTRPDGLVRHRYAIMSRSSSEGTAIVHAMEKLNIGTVVTPAMMRHQGRMVEPKPVRVLREATEEEYRAQYPLGKKDGGYRYRAIVYDPGNLTDAALFNELHLSEPKAVDALS